MLPPFAMYAPLARSDYYGDSAPSRASQPTRACPPPDWVPDGWGRARDGSHVHHIIA
jgi:hypothetical protein